MRLDRIQLVVVMAEKDVTIKALAEKAGVSRNTITAIKQGKSCSPTTASRIADALGVPVTELMPDRT